MTMVPQHPGCEIEPERGGIQCCVQGAKTTRLLHFLQVEPLRGAGQGGPDRADRAELEGDIRGFFKTKKIAGHAHGPAANGDIGHQRMERMTDISIGGWTMSMACDLLG